LKTAIALIEKGNKQDALKALESATGKLDRNELKLAEELSYGDRDKQYALLDDAIKDIKKQITASDQAEIAFSNLKDKLGGFFDRISS
jgi:hypothetical protein